MCVYAHLAYKHTHTQKEKNGSLGSDLELSPGYHNRKDSEQIISSGDYMWH